MNDIGKRLRELRESKKLSQAELAKALEKSQVAISKYETGNRQLDYEMLNKYARYFNVSTDYLLGRVNAPDELYISTEDYPDVLKALVIGDKSYVQVKAKTDDFSEEYTPQKKKDIIEKALKKINFSSYLKELKEKGELNLSKDMESFMWLLPREVWPERDRISLYQFLEYLENNDAFRKFAKDHSNYDSRGELVVNKENSNDNSNSDGGASSDGEKKFVKKLASQAKAVEALPSKYADLNSLLIPAGYFLEKAGGLYSFSGKHGAYIIAETEINELLSRTYEYLEFMCRKLEQKLLKKSGSPIHIPDPKDPNI